MSDNWVDEMIENNDDVSRGEYETADVDIIGDGWNYRLVRRKGEHEDIIGIHEVYYDSDGEPRACTKEPVGIFGRDYEKVAKAFAHAKQAFDKEVLDYEDF